MRSRALSAFVLSVLLGFTGCMQTENSSSDDAFFYGGTGGSAEFMEARLVFYENCKSCHSYHKMTEAQMKAAIPPLYVAGDPYNSPIYYRNVGSVGPGIPKDMPRGGSLSQGDLQRIFDWLKVAP